MKKYVKPELFFESFELSQQIAACQFDLDENTSNNIPCEFVATDNAPFDVTIFSKDACPVDGEIYCEHSSTELSGVLFNS